MTPTEVLTAARALIADPDHWCQGHYACDAVGNPVPHHHSEAVKRCASGAILYAAPTDGAYLNAKVKLLDAMRGSVAAFNDSHTHGEVLAAFDRAIEATK